jgi:hypothetical protein
VYDARPEPLPLKRASEPHRRAPALTLILACQVSFAIAGESFGKFPSRTSSAVSSIAGGAWQGTGLGVGGQRGRDVASRSARFDGMQGMHMQWLPAGYADLPQGVKRKPDAEAVAAFSALGSPGGESGKEGDDSKNGGWTRTAS